MRRRRGSRIVAWAATVYRLILGLWPLSLRERYRSEAVWVFRARVEKAREVGRLRAVTVSFRGLLDAIRDVSRGAEPSRVTAPRGRNPPLGEAMMSMVRDLRLASRRLWRSPRFSLVMVVTFAIAVGVTAATHAAVYGLMLSPLPFPEGERLVFIGEVETDAPAGAEVTSRYVLDLMDRTAASLEAVATYNIAGATLTTESAEPAALNGAVVTTNYFDVLGVQPRLGRSFLPEEGGEGAPARVIVSHGLWQDRLGGDEAVVGTTIQLNGSPYEVIGVMPPEFESPDEYTFTSHVRGRPSFWIAYRSAVAANLGRSHRGIGRLAAGASLDQIRAEAAAIPARVEDDGLTWPEGNRLVVQGLQDHVTAGVRPALRLLALAVVFVFLAGCVNAMGLSFARGLDRLEELRVKAALGARRGRLLRDMAMETTLVGVGGGLLGLGIGAVALKHLVTIAPADIPRLATIRLQLPTALLVMAMVLIVSIIAGLLPGLRLTRGWSDVGAASGGRHSTTGKGHRKTLHLFAGAQVALALVLLSGSALLVRSFVQLSGQDLGYEPGGLVIALVDLPAASAQERKAMEDDLLRRLDADPTVASAALATTAPQHGLNDFQVGLGIEGYDEEQDPVSFYRRVSDDFADAMGMRVLQGRFLRFVDVGEDGDTRIGPAVVNRAFVRRYLAGRNPLGVELNVWGYQSAHVVGVVDDTRFGWPGSSPEPAVYVPMLGSFSTVFIAVRAAEKMEPVPGRIRDAMSAVAPGVPVDEVFFSERLVRAATAQTEMTMTLLVGLALFTTALTCVGLYGTVAHTIASRRREMGIRLASGATAGRLVRRVVREGMRPILAGLLVGGVGAAVASGLTEALLFGVRRGDPASHAAAACFLIVVGALACYIPARRLSGLDPTEALREQ